MPDSGRIKRCVKVFQRAGQPMISVDEKKKELVGVGMRGMSIGRRDRSKSVVMIFQTRNWARFALLEFTIRRTIEGSV